MIIPLIHNVSSVHKLVEFARIAYGFGLRTLIATRVHGAAAQQGIAEVMKYAVRQGNSFIVLPDIKDAVEVIGPDKVVYLTKFDKDTKPIWEVDLGGKSLLVVNGIDMPFLKHEILPGSTLAHVIDRDIGSLGFLSIALYIIRERYGL